MKEGEKEEIIQDEWDNHMGDIISF